MIMSERRQSGPAVQLKEAPAGPIMKPDAEQTRPNAPDGQTDLQLVRKARQGDRSAFDLLVLKYQSRVASIISRYIYDSQEVMDLTQETFVKAYRAIERFRGDSAFYTWLYRIAVNTAKNFLEARGRRPQGVADVADAESYEDGGRLREVASPEGFLQRDQLRRLWKKPSEPCRKSCDQPSCCGNMKGSPMRTSHGSWNAPLAPSVRGYSGPGMPLTASSDRCWITHDD